MFTFCVEFFFNRSISETIESSTLTTCFILVVKNWICSSFLFILSSNWWVPTSGICRRWTIILNSILIFRISYTTFGFSKLPVINASSSNEDNGDCRSRQLQTQGWTNFSPLENVLFELWLLIDGFFAEVGNESLKVTSSKAFSELTEGRYQ